MYSNLKKCVRRGPPSDMKVKGSGFVD